MEHPPLQRVIHLIGVYSHENLLTIALADIWYLILILQKPSCQNSDETFHLQPQVSNVNIKSKDAKDGAYKIQVQ